MGKMIHEELSRSFIGSAMEVLNHLKPGLDEKLYERAMMIEPGSARALACWFRSHAETHLAGCSETAYLERKSPR